MYTYQTYLAEQKRKSNIKMIAKRLATEMGCIKAGGMSKDEDGFKRAHAAGIAACLFYLDVFTVDQYCKICDTIREPSQWTNTKQ